MNQISLQLWQSGMACLFGLALGLLYDFYRLWLNHRQRAVSVTAIGDFCFWLVAFVWCAFLLLWLNWGALRGYILLSFMLGLLLYFQLGSRWVRPLLHRLVCCLLRAVRRLSAVLRRMLRLIFAPLVFISTLIYRILWFLGSVFHRAGRACRQRVHKIRAKRRAKDADEDS